MVGLAALVGCGGSSSPTLKGNAAFRAAAISSAQSLGSGVAGPFAALKIVSPEGSKSALGTSSLSLSDISSMLFPSDTPTPGALTLVPGLNLYAGEASFSGDVATVTFYSDAAGTQPAGTVSMSLPSGAGALDSATGVAYSSYPEQIKIVINITGGNLPSVGNFVLNFSGSSGANTLTGSMTIHSAITLTLDLSLNDSQGVGGTITVVQNGETMVCKGVSGGLLDNIFCDATMSPGGWIGTGTFNLLNGTIDLNLSNSTGSASASIDSSGALNITYGDGTKETVAHPDQAQLVSSSSSGGNNVDGGGDGSANVNDGGASVTDGGIKFTSGSVGFTGQAYAAVVQIGNDGQILGTVTPQGGGAAQYVFAPSFAATALSLGTGIGYGLTDTGKVLGATTLDATSSALIWNDPGNSPPTTLDGTGYTSVIAYAMTDAGQIIGRGKVGSNSFELIWSSASATAALLPMPSNFAVPFQAPLMGVSYDGQLVGWEFMLNENYHVLYWSSPTTMPTVLTSAASAFSQYFINQKGQIAGNNYAVTNCIGPTYQDSPTSVAVTLPSIYPNDHGCGDYINAGLNNKGVVVGTAAAEDLYHTHAVIWQNDVLTDLNTLVPTGQSYYLSVGVAINDHNQVACQTLPLDYDMAVPTGDQPFAIVTLQ